MMLLLLLDSDVSGFLCTTLFISPEEQPEVEAAAAGTTTGEFTRVGPVASVTVFSTFAPQEWQKLKCRSSSTRHVAQGISAPATAEFSIELSQCRFFMIAGLYEAFMHARLPLCLRMLQRSDPQRWKMKVPICFALVEKSAFLQKGRRIELRSRSRHFKRPHDVRRRGYSSGIPF
jgi:hypothetical protein